MKIRNKGPRGRSIAVVGYPSLHVEAGETVEVDDKLGESLLKQTRRWERPKSTKTDRGD